MDDELSRRFDALVRPQIRSDISNTLADMLGSCFEVSPSAVDYVLSKLWADDWLYRKRVGAPEPEEEEEQ